VLTSVELGGDLRQQALAVLAPMIGLPVEKVRISKRGALIVDLGAPKRMQTYVRGEWRIGIFNSAWRLGAGGRVLVGSGDDWRRAAEAMQDLLIPPLSTFEIDESLLDSNFYFENLRLQIFPLYTGPDDRFDAWTVWMPSEQQLRVGPGPRLRIDGEMDHSAASAG